MIFDLIIDEKVTVWTRNHVKVEAETLDKAVKKCKTEGTDAASSITDSEYIYETEEFMHPEFNNNYATIEVMDEHYNVLATNEIV